MATQDDVRRIALSLPETSELPDRFAFAVANKGKFKAFAWVWNERREPKRPRVPNPAVLAVRVPSELDKHLLIDAAPDRFFTEPHYNGFPAVLVRLEAVTAEELEGLLREGWRCQAPKSLLRAAEALPPGP